MHPVATLRRFDYPVELPPGPGGDCPSEDGNVRKCDRCTAEFTVRSDLDSVRPPSSSSPGPCAGPWLNSSRRVRSQDGRQACQYHFGRMVTEKIGGQKQRVYSCCPAVAATPCQTGPHVFKVRPHPLLYLARATGQYKS